jgi:hypothetical protein
MKVSLTALVAPCFVFLGGCDKPSSSMTQIAFSETLSESEAAVPVAILSISPDQRCTPQKKIFAGCTGSRVGNDIVITAAHCTEGIIDLYVFDKTVDHFRLLNNLPDRNFACVDDGSLEQLKSAIPILKEDISVPANGADVAVIRIRQKLSHPIVRVGSLMAFKPKLVTLLGLGRTTCVKGEPGREEVFPGSNIFGAGRVTLTVSDAKYDGPEPWFVALKSGTLTHPCPGDSGSGIFTMKGNDLVLLGVDSRTSTDFSLKGTTHFFTNFSEPSVASFLRKEGILFIENK